MLIKKTNNNKIRRNKIKTSIKKEEELWQNAAVYDSLKYLGPIYKEEVEYYKNLKYLKI
jgi:hypothetical protein